MTTWLPSWKPHFSMISCAETSAGVDMARIVQIANKLDRLISGWKSKVLIFVSGLVDGLSAFQ
jgi:hypothetical protein